MDSAGERRSAALGDELARVLELLSPHLDVIEGAVEAAEPPSWCRERDWSGFLLSLSDEALAFSESSGFDALLLQAHAAPPTLLALARAVRACTRLARLETAAARFPREALRGVRARKREQLQALLAALTPLAHEASRIVDVGAGSGHFSRLAAGLFRRPVLALDRDARLSANASARALRADARDVSVRTVELGAEALSLLSSDLAVGLHACGELGDRLVLAAAVARCDVALVSCCPQKIGAPRRTWLSRRAGGFTLTRAALGLANLSAGERGVEATLAENLAAREARLALRQLLAARGVALRAGEEMRGINRRRAQAGLAELARVALAARALAPASDSELRFHRDKARADYAIVRRLSLPRFMLARAVELSVVLDRAAALEERGHHVRLAALFEPRVTPRNTLLLASVHADRLPGA